MAGTTPLGTTVTIDSTVCSDILDVSFSPGSVELIDVTDLSDTNRSKIAGFVDIGTVSVTMNWDKTIYAALIASADGASMVTTITFSDTSTWAGDGVLDITGFSISSGAGVSSTVNIQQLSAWTFTAAS